MNLRRQLLLVSLLTLVLPWAGCQFVRETESALRSGQERMLMSTAAAIADSLSQFPNDFLDAGAGDFESSQIYAHPLAREPVIDGYFDDWPLDNESLRELPGARGSKQFVVGSYRQNLYLYIDVHDSEVHYESDDPRQADHVLVATGRPGDNDGRVLLASGAPGAIAARQIIGTAIIPEPRVSAYWLDTVNGYRVEARIPRNIIGSRLGIEVMQTDGERVVASRSFDRNLPGELIEVSNVLQSVAAGYAQGARLILTARSGWRLAAAGELGSGDSQENNIPSGWQAVLYGLLVETGASASLAEPDPSGREQQAYVARALNGQSASSWFRVADSGRAVIAVAHPVFSGSVQTGALLMQQDTDTIVGLTNDSLTRLITFATLATVGVAAVLLGYASWLSSRIRRLSNAADHALDSGQSATDLPSGTAGDEIGDLSRSFSSVLGQLSSYNNYLRTLASKLSHEMRTPLTIVRSSLENLEHEPLPDESRAYAERARSGVDRLQKILNAMSEANRVEQLMENAELESFEVAPLITAATDAYRDAWPNRHFELEASTEGSLVEGSPELLIQMLDKLIDNAVDFSKDDDTISLRLLAEDDEVVLSVRNPGPLLPETMRHRLFESMVSVRDTDSAENMGLGLNIAKIIAEGHRGTISAHNTDDGVEFSVRLPSNLYNAG